MLAEPIVLTGAGSFAAISRGPAESTYQLASGAQRIIVGHQFRPQRHRFAVRYVIDKLAVDPLMSDRNIPASATISVVVDKPVVGFTTDELALAARDMISGYLMYSTEAVLRKVLGGET